MIKLRFIFIVVLFFCSISVVQAQNDSINEIIAPIDEVVDSSDFSYYTEEEPLFPGGKEGLENAINSGVNSRLTKKLKKKFKQLPDGSTIYVSYVIETDGSISNIKIVKGVDLPKVHKILIECISDLPRWKPAKSNGTPVRLRYVQKIKLK